jgi:hypothetical protein
MQRYVTDALFRRELRRNRGIDFPTMPALLFGCGVQIHKDMSQHWI